MYKLIILLVDYKLLILVIIVLFLPVSAVKRIYYFFLSAGITKYNEDEQQHCTFSEANCTASVIKQLQLQLQFVK